MLCHKKLLIVDISMSFITYSQCKKCMEPIICILSNLTSYMHTRNKFKDQQDHQSERLGYDNRHMCRELHHGVFLIDRHSSQQLYRLQIQG